MATLSQEARHKARQIRELSRDLNTHHSVASSTGSHHGTVSDDTSTTFDPMEDGDCFMSTDLMNYHLNAQNSSQTQSQKLPELRDTAKKYNRWAPRAQQEPAPTFSFNQSAIDRVFQDFDSGPILSTDEFELGRAVKTQQRSPYRAPLTEFSSNLDSQSHVVTINNVDINYTPTGRPQQKPSRPSRSRALSGLEKSARWLEENLRPKSPTLILPEHPQLPAYSEHVNSPVVISSPFVTTPVEQTAPAKTRKVVPLPAHVTNESDTSILSELPSKVTKKTTRTKQSPNSTTYTRNPAQAQQINITTKSTTPSQTQHSFALPPQVGDVSKLVSRRSLDDESVAQAKKTKKFRSFSADHARAKRDQKDFVEDHEEEEEIDIYEKAEILQREVDMLKGLRQQDTMLITNLKKGRTALETEVEKLERGLRRDSGVGSFNSIDGARSSHCSEGCKYKDELEITTKERNELQLRYGAIQSRLDEITGHNQQLTRNNDELGNANEELANTNEELNNHINTLLKERDELRLLLNKSNSNLDQTSKNHQQFNKTTQQLTRRNQQLLTEIDELHNNIEALCKERDDVRLQVDNVGTNLDQINALHQQSTKTIQQLTHKNQELASSNMALGNAIEALSKERDELRVRLDNSSSLEHDQAHLTRRNQELSTANRNMGNAIEGLSKERDELRAQLENTTSGLEQEQLNQQRKNRELANSNKTLGNALQSLSKQRDELHLKLEQVKHGAERVTGDQILIAANEDLKRQVERLHKSVKQRDTVIQTLLNSTETIYTPNKQGDEMSDADADDTIETIKSIHSQRSGISQKSHRSNKSDYTHQSNNSRRSSRHEDVDETMETVQSQRSGRSQHSHKSDQSQRFKGSARSSRHDPAPSKGPTGILKNADSQKQNQRRSKDDEDLTSAFIIPDIISRTPDLAKHNVGDHPALTPSARGILDGLCEHNSRNCIVCARVATHDPDAGQKPAGKIHVPKPVPVSERMPVVEDYEDEPTLRPSVPPGVALATVIKAIKDEIEHLKIKQADILNLYNKADTSLGMREKKKLHAQLTAATAERDGKEDQLYALFDVLEGQKMARQEVDESFDIDEELPWEGIEDTE